MALKKQLSVMLVNQAGEGARLCSVLKDAGINIEAVSAFEFTEGSVLRLVVKEDKKATQLLREKGYGTLLRVVVAAMVEDRPGSLGELLGRIAETGHNVNYCYGSTVPGCGKAEIILAVDDPVTVDRILAEGGK